MLNNDVFQCENVIVYRMERGRIAMSDKTAGKKGLCAPMVGVFGRMQAFGLGMVRVIPRYLACDMYGQYDAFVIQVGECPLGNGLFGMDKVRGMTRRHSLLPCRALLFLCQRCGCYQQEHCTNVFYQSLHFLPFEGAKVANCFEKKANESCFKRPVDKDISFYK